METVARRDFYAEVTQKIIAQLEQGTLPWCQPWGFMEPAQNHFSGHQYRGINALLMLLDDFKTPYFATMRQINEAGGRVRKGTKASTVFFNDVIFRDASGKKLPADVAKARLSAGDKSVSKYPFLRLYPVFNMGDVDGCEVRPSSHRIGGENEPIPACADFVTALNLGDSLRHTGTDEAYFRASTDTVVLPDINRFTSAEMYYSVLFHELTHWTGHPDRLNRATLTDARKYGDTNYSKEELTAEIGACFLCNHHGIETPDTFNNTAGYIENWLKRLRNDKRFIWEAATEAQSAFSHLIDRAAQFTPAPATLI